METGEPVAEPVESTVDQRPSVTKPQRGMLLLSCLLTGLVMLAIGFLLGKQTTRKSTPPAPVQAQMPVEPKPAPPEPVTIRVKPIIEKAPAEPTKPEEKKQVVATAEATLRAFLQAPDWVSRSAYVLFPEKIRAAMEAYSREVPDGPTAFNSITAKQTQLDESTGYTLLIFFVSTDAFPSGIPVAVQETRNGWQVDWQTFVEFRDKLFQKFADGPAGQTGIFHLIASQPPLEPTDNTSNEHFLSVLLNAPLNPTQQLAFVKKTSEASATLRAATTGDEFFTPVLEVAKRETAEGKTYLEVLRVVASNWSPREP